MAENYGTAICRHIRAFYSVAAGEPIVYWPFDSSILGAGAILVKRQGDTGDICHYDIEKLSHKEAKEIFGDHALNDNLFFCNSDEEEPFSVNKLKELLN